MSYPQHLLVESYPSAEMQMVYSTALVDWAEERKKEVKKEERKKRRD